MQNWQLALLGCGLALTSLLLIIWWRQRTFRWPVILATCACLAIALSWWSSIVFDVADYRAGCDGLCPGFRGAPIAVIDGETAGASFRPLGFVVNSLIYLTALLGWNALLQALLWSQDPSTRQSGARYLFLHLLIAIIPLALAPLYLPPAEARARGDLQRTEINARREVYLYDQQAAMPIIQIGLEDVRPRLDGQSGMRVCLRLYTFFYLPAGRMYLDMAPEGVHSTNGGVLSNQESCWQETQ